MNSNDDTKSVGATFLEIYRNSDENFQVRLTNCKGKAICSEFYMKSHYIYIFYNIIIITAKLFALFVILRPPKLLKCSDSKSELLFLTKKKKKIENNQVGNV